MAKPIYAPRVNNNDDTVQLIGLNVAAGDLVKLGDVIAEVETDKSVAEVEAERDGYVLDILHQEDDQVAVGSVLMWIGDTPDEAIPEMPTAEPESPATRSGRPTAKARLLLQRHGLSADQVSSSGERLSAADVEAYLAANGSRADLHKEAAQATVETVPDVAGELHDLSAEEHGMLGTVAWHRDRAASAYLEIEYDAGAWEQVAADYVQRHGLMLSPLMSLWAYRLVQLALERPKINSTIVGSQRFQYSPVNLGFTVQAGSTLYLTVVNDAGNMDLDRFIEALGEVQRHAMGHKLKPRESQGATIAFSSMSRWGVTRHIPILPPNTALMVAHAASSADGTAVLGASYDHRVLSGFDTVRLLQELAKPPTIE
jgi:pyruvate dehydrogenase E2 component (dihydrolipoamide acetyltransferase)